MGYDLNRFHKGQEIDYSQALSEIKAGRKRSHWIWYIFPQIEGLGRSGMSEYYGIKGMGEAKAYMDDPVLSQHLIEISEALLALESNDPAEVMGWPDNLKLRSSMTLFREARPDIEVFQNVLDRYYGGEPDERTLELIGQ